MKQSQRQAGGKPSGKPPRVGFKMSNPIAVGWVWFPQGPWMKGLIFRLWHYGEVIGTLVSRTDREFSGHWGYAQSFPFSALLSGESFALLCASPQAPEQGPLIMDQNPNDEEPRCTFPLCR